MDIERLIQATASRAATSDQPCSPVISLNFTDSQIAETIEVSDVAEVEDELNFELTESASDSALISAMKTAAKTGQSITIDFADGSNYIMQSYTAAEILKQFSVWEIERRMTSKHGILELAATAHLNLRKTGDDPDAPSVKDHVKNSTFHIINRLLGRK